MWLMLWLALSAVLPVQGSADRVTTPGQPPSSKIWIGRYLEFEDYLRSAKIERFENIGTGVTLPRHAFFETGGLAGGAIVKNLPPGKRDGFFESYKSEIAAYKLDRMLKMDMVPPTIERKVDRDTVSIQLWVENVRTLKQVTAQKVRSPDVVGWNRQLHRTQVFDDLVGNIDENSGNLLFDQAWNFIKVDHSRCFTETAPLPFPIGETGGRGVMKIDRPFFERIKALNQAAVRTEIGNLLEPGALQALFRRRDSIVKAFEGLARKNGEDAVFERWPE